MLKALLAQGLLKEVLQVMFFSNTIRHHCGN